MVESQLVVASLAVESMILKSKWPVSSFLDRESPHGKAPHSPLCQFERDPADLVDGERHIGNAVSRVLDDPRVHLLEHRVERVPVVHLPRLGMLEDSFLDLVGQRPLLPQDAIAVSGILCILVLEYGRDVLVESNVGFDILRVRLRVQQISRPDSVSGHSHPAEIVTLGRRAWADKSAGRAVDLGPGTRSQTGQDDKCRYDCSSHVKASDVATETRRY